MIAGVQWIVVYLWERYGVFPPNILDLHLVESMNLEPRMQMADYNMNHIGHQDHRDTQDVAFFLQKL